MTDAKKLNIHGKLDWVFCLNMDAIEKKACGPGVPKAHGGHSHNRYLTMQFRLVYTVQSIPSVYIRPPPSPPSSGICHLVDPGIGNLSEDLCPGVGHLQFF